MATKEENRKMRALGEYLDKKLKNIYGRETGFFICVCPFVGDNEDEFPDGVIADYLSNCKREDGIAWMKGTVKRFEENDGIHWEGSDDGSIN